MPFYTLFGNVQVFSFSKAPPLFGIITTFHLLAVVNNVPIKHGYAGICTNFQPAFNFYVTLETGVQFPSFPTQHTPLPP